MAQSSLADCLPTDSPDETERQPERSEDNDASLEAEEEISRAQDKDLPILTATVQSTPPEGSAHPEQQFEQPDDRMSSDVRSTSQRECPDTNGEPWPGRTSLKVSEGVDSPSHSNENAVSGDQELAQLGAIILGEIRDQFLHKLGAAGAPYHPGLSVDYYASPPVSIMVKRDKKVDLVWSATPGTLSDKVADAIRRAWPRNRNVKGMVDLLLDSDGTMPFSKVSWQHFETSVNESIWHRWCLDAAESVRRKHNKSSPDHADTTSPPSRFRGKIIYCQLENYKKEQHMFPLDQLASALSYDEPFHLPPSKRGLGKSCDDFDFDHLLSFLDRDFQGGLDNQGFAGYQFQLRYFCPIDELRARGRPVRYPCFLGHRQRAIIGRGSAIQYLEEKRARVSLRVSPFFPGLFNIFILADHNMLPIREEWTPNPTGEHTEFNWARYGLKPCGMGTFFTHFMFEVSRVLDRSLDAWGETLDSIDKLVHVNLDDFEDEKRVEDLMFDKSFTRSKDYFVAIQLLRITDEWLDEVLQTIDGLRNMPALYRRLFCIDAAEDNINAAIKGMKERTTRLQSRIRKKAEEIKSLRDGLFNATSLREATKAMALNQAIYVFTVVTVLFTPVSFLATFWALPFLNNPAEEGSEMVPEPSSFRNSFVTLPLLTYALVVGIAWYMRPDQSRYRLSDWLTGILDTTRERLNSAWNGFPREMKRRRRRGQGGPDAGDSA